MLFMTLKPLHLILCVSKLAFSSVKVKYFVFPEEPACGSLRLSYSYLS